MPNSNVNNEISLEKSMSVNDTADPSKVRIPCPFSPSRSFVDKERLQTHMNKNHCDELLQLASLEKITPSLLVEKLLFYRNNGPTLRRIPKGARFSAADKYAKLINECISKNSVFAWYQHFPTFLFISKGMKKNH